jgi:hypothetical protein
VVRQGNRADAVQLDLLLRILDLVLEKGRGTVSCAGVVYQKPDVDVFRRLRDPFTHVGLGQVLKKNAGLDTVLLARVSRDLVQRRSVSRDQHEIQSASG